MLRGRTPALLLALLALAAVPAGAVADSWSGTGAMSGDRTLHTATLLPSGQVLVAGGGAAGFNSTNTSERWNPATGQWIGSPSFATDRYRHPASLLADGRVLISGGRQNTGPVDVILSSANLFDPASNTWSPTGAMPLALEHAQQVTLQDGRVLVAGGYENLTEASNSEGSDQAELFDPATGTWTRAPTTPFFQEGHTLTLLNDGSVLLAGGQSSGTRHPNGFRYFPVTGRWRNAGIFAVARSNHVAALLPDGRVLIAGGTSAGAVYLRSAAIYDPATNAWTEVAPMATAREDATATTLPNGKVLVAGGGQGSAYFDTTELFDPATNTWSPGPRMAATRGRHTATLLADGRVLVTGGTGRESGASRTIDALSSAEIYTPDGWPFSRGGGGGGGQGGPGGGQGGSGGQGGGGPSGSGTPPISGLTLSATRFRAAGSGPSVTTARKRRVPVGTTISYRDAAAGTATFAVQKPASGRRANGGCARPTRANRRKARCTRWVTVGSFRHADTAGPNRLRFSGRVRGHKLSPGRYRLSITARVGDGTPSVAQVVGFRIVG